MTDTLKAEWSASAASPQSTKYNRKVAQLAQEPPSVGVGGTGNDFIMRLDRLSAGKPAGLCPSRRDIDLGIWAR